MFFDSMPKILYDSKGNGELKIVTNLLKRVAVRTKIKTNALILDTYNVKNGETPESIADKLYDDPELHWVVLMVNDITDRYHQWPMYEQQFNTYVSEKYDNPDGVHHYEISQTSGDTDFYSNATTITNREYEEREQDKKRQIKLLDPAFLDQFVEEYKVLMGESVL